MFAKYNAVLRGHPEDMVQSLKVGAHSTAEYQGLVAQLNRRAEVYRSITLLYALLRSRSVHTSHVHIHLTGPVHLTATCIALHEFSTQPLFTSISISQVHYRATYIALHKFSTQLQCTSSSHKFITHLHALLCTNLLHSCTLQLPVVHFLLRACAHTKRIICVPL